MVHKFIDSIVELGYLTIQPVVHAILQLCIIIETLCIANRILNVGKS